MWDPSLSQANTAFLPPLGRLFLATLLLLTILTGCGAQEVGDTSGPIIQGAVDTASRGKDAAGAVVGEAAQEGPIILATAGSAAGRLVGAAGEKGSGISGAIINTGWTAWAALSESDLTALLYSRVHWAAYDDLMTDHPELQGTVGPVIEFATGLSPDGDIGARDILINTALLAVPATKLGPVLGKGAKQAIKVGPDVMIMVDDIVVAEIKGGAGRASGAIEGSIDDLGRVVAKQSSAKQTVSRPVLGVSMSPALLNVSLLEVPIQAQVVVGQIRAENSGGTVESGAFFANVGTRLPIQAPGYYREYLVESSGSPNRGMQRIVLGDNGEVYFTPDGGNSFVEISLADVSTDETRLAT